MWFLINFVVTNLQDYILLIHGSQSSYTTITTCNITLNTFVSNTCISKAFKHGKEQNKPFSFCCMIIPFYEIFFSKIRI